MSSIFDPKPPGINTPMVDIDVSKTPNKTTIYDILNYYVGCPITDALEYRVKSQITDFLIRANKHRYPEIDTNKIEVRIIRGSTSDWAACVFYDEKQIIKMDEDGFIYLEQEKQIRN